MTIDRIPPTLPALPDVQRGDEPWIGPPLGNSGQEPPIAPPPLRHDEPSKVQPPAALAGMQDSLDGLAAVARKGGRFELSALFWLHACTQLISFTTSAAGQLEEADWTNLKNERANLRDAAQRLADRLTPLDDVQF